MNTADLMTDERATRYPAASITQHTGIVKNKKGKAFQISYTRINDTGQVLVLMDKQYCQFLGYRNRLDLFIAAGLDRFFGEPKLYHDPYNNKLYNIKADKVKFVEGLELFPLFPPGFQPSEGSGRGYTPDPL